MGGWNSVGEVAGSVRAALAIAAALAFSGAGAATLGRFQSDGVVARAKLASYGQAKLSVTAVRPVDVAGCDPASLSLEFEVRVTRHDGVAGKDSLKFVKSGSVELVDSAGRTVFKGESPVQKGVAERDRVAGRWMPAFYPLDRMAVPEGGLERVLFTEWNDIPKKAEETGVTVEVRNARIVRAPTKAEADALALAARENPNPMTTCNPIDLEYMIKHGKKKDDGTVYDIYIESADPALAVYKGEYWLFASHGEGYWVSKDLARWEFIRVDVAKPVLKEFLKYAPATCVIGDTLYLCHSEGGRIIKTTDPRNPDAWEDVGRPDGWMDPGMLYDDPAEGGDGFVYLYRGLSHHSPIEVIKLDPRNGMKKVAGPFDCAWPDKNNRGYEVAGDDNTRYDGKDTQEGAWPVKFNGRYYLTCAVPGTQYASYSDNCYVADSPTGPFTFCDNSPVVWKSTGFTRGAGHGCLFRDLKGRWWKVDTCTVKGFNRRLVLVPAMFDEKGGLYTNTVMSDYPFYVPGRSKDPFGDPGPGWGLLSYDKEATASSNATEANMAFDENMSDAWVAATSDPGEWLMVDLGRECDVRSVQVNFLDVGVTEGGRDNDFAYRYLLEYSTDGRTWRVLVDRTKQTANRQHEYVEFAGAVPARHIRLTNKGPVPGRGRLAVSGLRVFGVGGGKAPPAVDMDGVVFDRRKGNSRTAVMEWPASRGAQGYIVRYGISPERLHTHFQVADSQTLVMNSLNRGVDYYFTIDAYNESGVTRGTKTLRMPAPEPRVEGFVSTDGKPPFLNPAFTNRVAGVAVHEAEKARASGRGVVPRYEACASGAYALHGLGGAGTAAEFANVRATAGAATLRVCYSAIADAHAGVSFNGGAATMIELPKTRGWPTFATVDVPVGGLKASNTVRIAGAGVPFLLDWVQLLPAAPSGSAKGGR